MLLEETSAAGVSQGNIDTGKYISQLEKRVSEQEQLISLLNEKISRLESTPSKTVQSSSSSLVLPSDTHMKKKKAKPAQTLSFIGTRKTDIDTVVNVRYSQFFLSRLDPATSAKHVGENLLSSLPDLPLVKCSKLKTRHNSYASFHVMVPESHVSLVSCEEAWPEGCLVKKFLGKLLKSYVIESFSSDSSIPEQGAAPSAAVVDAGATKTKANAPVKPNNRQASNSTSTKTQAPSGNVNASKNMSLRSAVKNT